MINSDLLATVLRKTISNNYYETTVLPYLILTGESPIETQSAAVGVGTSRTVSKMCKANTTCKDRESLLSFIAQLNYFL